MIKLNATTFLMALDVPNPPVQKLYHCNMIWYSAFIGINISTVELEKKTLKLLGTYVFPIDQVCCEIWINRLLTVILSCKYLPGWIPHPSLRGTLLVLHDDVFSDMNHSFPKESGRDSFFSKMPLPNVAASGIYRNHFV